MGRKLLLVGCVAVIAVACGDSDSNGGGAAGGTQAAGQGGRAGAAGGGNTVGGTQVDGGAHADGGAGEVVSGGMGTNGDAGAGSAQAGESNGVAGDGSTGGAGNQAGAGSEGGASPQGMAGEPGSNAGAPGEGGAPSCADAPARYLVGTLAGEAVDYLAHSGSAFSRAAPELFDLKTRVGSDGLLHIWGPSRLFSIGDSTSAEAHLVTASEGPNGGTHYCAASGSASRVSTFRHTATLTDWTSLGTCPSAGTGTITGCYEQTGVGPVVPCNGGQAHLVGTIGSDALDASYVTNTVVKEGSTDVNTFIAFGEAGLLMLSTTSGTGTGYLRMPDDGPFPGLIICVGTASLTPGALSDRYTFTLTSLGVVGTCPGATGAAGQLDGCL